MSKSLLALLKKHPKLMCEHRRFIVRAVAEHIRKQEAANRAAEASK